MKKYNAKIYLVLLLSIVFFWTAVSFAQVDSLNREITLKTYLESESVPLNREVVYHVELSWAGDLDLYQISDIGDPAISNLALRGSGSSNRLTTDSNGNPEAIRRVTYYFTPSSIGMGYIDGLTIQYKDSQTGDSETLISQRISVKITEPLADEKDGFLPGTILLWVLLILFLAMAVYFVIRFLQKRKENEEEEIKISLEQKYLDLLHSTVHLSNGAAKENVSALKKILNSYVAEKYSIPGNVDMAIISDRLKKLNIPDDKVEKIDNLYKKAELTQYAGEPLQETELHLFYDSVEMILKNIIENESESGGK